MRIKIVVKEFVDIPRGMFLLKPDYRISSYWALLASVYMLDCKSDLLVRQYS